MAGKPMATVDRLTAAALDNISKNTLLDMLVDMTLREIGEDASPEQLLETIQRTLDTVARIRGDKPVNLVARRATYQKANDAYRERMLREKSRNPS